MRSIFAASFLITSLLRADSTLPLIRAVSVVGTGLHVDLATQVGRPYDSAAVAKDVRRLWGTGRFSDIRVDWTEGAVIFRVLETRTLLKAARLQSRYLSRGFLDANDWVEGAKIRVEAGRRYQVKRATIRDESVEAESPGDLCPSLLAAKREAERQGILDFSVSVNTQEFGEALDLDATIDRGRPYRVRRIDFAGLHHYSDATARRNLLLDEGRLLDERLLRKSIVRLNQTTLFEPLDEHSVHIRTDEAAGLADVTIQLRERRGGAWNISGPVGPASFAGPLEASLRSRLPAWGSGLLDLSTYTATISLYAFAPPLVPALSVLPRHTFIPILALQRPFLPGKGWRSGFYIAPQLGLRGLGLIYATTQVQQRLLPLLNGDRGLESALPVSIQTPKGERTMYCEAPAPRLMPLRVAAGFAVRFLGVVTGI